MLGNFLIFLAVAIFLVLFLGSLVVGIIMLITGFLTKSPTTKKIAYFVLVFPIIVIIFGVILIVSDFTRYLN